MHLLHLLPPEAAHALTIKALQLGLGPTLKNKKDLSIPLFGKFIRNPIGLSGGADKEAAALPGWSKMGFGLVEAGTVTLHMRDGNPQPRMWRMKGNAVINWLGLPGSGLEPFTQNLIAFQYHPARRELCVGASIASPDGVLEEFKILAQAVAPDVDYITLNASCPNVAHDGDHSFEYNAAMQIRAAKEGTGQGGKNVPVLVKLGPTRDATALARMVDAALGAGVDGFVATNTVPFSYSSLITHHSTLTWPKHNDKEVGGYSGPQLLDISCWMVSEIRMRIPTSMPIIGVGGVQSGDDAKRLLNAGANAIQLYTGLIYKGPALVEEIADTLSS